MKILVTGATGFLGTHPCSQLEWQGHELVRLNSQNCDLTQPNSLWQFNDQEYKYPRLVEPIPTPS